LWAVCLVALPSTAAYADDQSADDLFGSNKGNWHPSLGLSGFWTDNLFNTPDNEKSDYSAVISPGLWLAFPARFDKPASVPTVNNAAGGMAYSMMDDMADYGLFQFYASYAANLVYYDEYSDEDYTSQKAEAKLGFYPGPKTRLELSHAYDDNREDFGVGGSSADQDDQYTGNLTTLMAGYQLTPKLGLEATTSYYNLDYDESFSTFRDREDWSYGGKLTFELTAKLDLFGEFEYVDVDYDSGDELDSQEKLFYAGVTWDVTDKTSGLAKVGYNNKEYDGDASDEDELQLEAQLDYSFSPKTSMQLNALRYLNETDTLGTSGRLTHEVAAEVSYQLAEKVSASLKAGWLNDDYEGDITVGTQTDSRDDDYLSADLELTWQTLRWLELGCGYSWEERDSNFDAYDYTTNIVFVSLTGSF
jgi:hypothetical protein